jgi:hypothetical protein
MSDMAVSTKLVENIRTNSAATEMQKCILGIDWARYRWAETKRERNSARKRIRGDIAYFRAIVTAGF